MKNTKYRNILMLPMLIVFAAIAPQAFFAQGTVAPKTPSDWHTLKPATSVFSISVPAKATVETEKLGPSTGNMTATYYTSEGEGSFAMIADLYDLPIKADLFSDKDTNETFDGFRRGLVTGFKSALEQKGSDLEVKFETPITITVDGLKGIDQNVTIGIFKARTRMLLAKDHIFMFFVMAMPGADEGTSDMVINSFKYLGR